MARRVERANRYLTGWVGYFRLCTSPSSFSNFDAHIRRRLRAILVRQKKRSRHLYRHLQTRGVSRGQAWKTAYQIRSVWKRSSSLCPQSHFERMVRATACIALRPMARTPASRRSKDSLCCSTCSA
ncbi:MAG: hypothetical protein KF752_09445 [Pirellulaceae bacterium]|nr:hypothetical protein [Pirellulaceae bacterium]